MINLWIDLLKYGKCAISIKIPYVYVSKLLFFFFEEEGMEWISYGRFSERF